MAKQQNAAGVQMYQQGAFDASIQKFQKAIATSPTSGEGYYNLAAAYHGRGAAQNRPEDLTLAESFYNQCLDRDPNNEDCYRGLAVLLARQDRTDQAKRLLEGWAARSPTITGPKIELARLSEELGDKEKAKQLLQEALLVDPKDSRALAALGTHYERAGDHAQALATYQRSLSQNQFQPELNARLARLQSAFSPTPLAGGQTQLAPVATTPAQPTGAGATIKRY